MKNQLLAVALWLILPLAAFGQYKMYGNVLDAEDGSPLYGAHLVVKETFKGVLSGSNGSYVIQNLNKGTYQVAVSFLGFETKTQTIELHADTKLDFALQRSATLTDEIVIMATRANYYTPATYTNLSSEELMAGNLGQDLPVILSMTPSMVVSSDAGNGIGYTWMNIRGSDNTRINVTMNGIPMNDAESHGVWWVNTPDLVSSTDNIQIQRGVGLSTHGAGAFGATISLQTNTFSDDPFAEISPSFGSFNTFRTSAGFGTGLIGEHWTVEGRLSYISSDGYIDRATSDLKSYYIAAGYSDQKTVVRAITFSGVEKTYQAWYGVPGDSLESNRTFNPAGLYYDENGNIQYYDNETDNYQQDHYQLHFTRTLSNKITANLSGHYTNGRGYYEQYRQNDSFKRYGLHDLVIGDTVISRTDLVRQRWLDNHFYGFTYSINYQESEQWHFTLGGGYHDYMGQHFGEIVWARFTGNADINYRYYDNDSRKKDFNTFLKAEYRINNQWNIFSDLQYRGINYNFLGLAWLNESITPLQHDVEFHFFNPKFGVNYRLNFLHNLYMYFGIGNREPVRRDFTEASPESWPKHETLRNLEAGYRYSGNKFTLSGNLFLMHYKNQLILTGEINDVGGYTRANIDKSYRWGLELAGAVIITPSLDWQGNLTLSQNLIPHFVEYVDTYDNDWNWIGSTVTEYHNTEIAFSPPVIAASQFSWRAFKGFSAHLDSKFVSRQFIDNTSSTERMLDSYFVNNVRFSYIVNPGFLKELRFNLLVNNVTNTDYITNAWVYKGMVGDQGMTTIEDGFFPQAGINFLVGMNILF